MSDEDEDFGRSFLDRGPAPRPDEEAADRPAGGSGESGIQTRAYLLTGGRTGGGKADVKIETMVMANPSASPRPLTTEEATILADVRADARAIVEISDRLRLPLGVVQVIVGDLVHEAILVQSNSVTAIHDDVAFLERLIDRVSAL